MYIFNFAKFVCPPVLFTIPTSLLLKSAGYVFYSQIRPRFKNEDTLKKIRSLSQVSRMAEWNISAFLFPCLECFELNQNNLKFVTVLLWSHLHDITSLEKALPLLRQNLFTCTAKFITVKSILKPLLDYRVIRGHFSNILTTSTPTITSPLKIPFLSLFSLNQII